MDNKVPPIRTKHQAKQEIQHILDKKPTDIAWLLLQANKVSSGKLPSSIEKLLLIVTGFLLLLLYAFVQSGSIKAAHFFFGLVVFNVIVAVRYVHRCDKIDQQLKLLSEAIHRLQAKDVKDIDNRDGR